MSLQKALCLTAFRCPLFHRGSRLAGGWQSLPNRFGTVVCFSILRILAKLRAKWGMWVWIVEGWGAIFRGARAKAIQMIRLDIRLPALECVRGGWSIFARPVPQMALAKTVRLEFLASSFILPLMESERVWVDSVSPETLFRVSSCNSGSYIIASINLEVMSQRGHLFACHGQTYLVLWNLERFEIWGC